jgi:hypothetical protein
MSTRTFFSNRVYKNNLPKELLDAISHALLVFNRAKHFSFNTSAKEKRSGQNNRSKSMHLTVKERFNLDDYYANSAVQEASSIQKSNTELNKLYISIKTIIIVVIHTRISKYFPRSMN